jgi:hypothetical protein
LLKSLVSRLRIARERLLILRTGLGRLRTACGRVLVSCCKPSSERDGFGQGGGALRGESLPLDCNWKLPRPWDGLDNDIRLLYAGGQQLCLGSAEKRLNDGMVPAGVDNADPKVLTIVVLRGGSFERHSRDDDAPTKFI